MVFIFPQKRLLENDDDDDNFFNSFFTSSRTTKEIGIVWGLGFRVLGH
jgi:hypothetical protein